MLLATLFPLPLHPLLPTVIVLLSRHLAVCFARLFLRRGEAEQRVRVRALRPGSPPHPLSLPFPFSIVFFTSRCLRFRRVCVHVCTPFPRPPPPPVCETVSAYESHSLTSTQSTRGKRRRKRLATVSCAWHILAPALREERRPYPPRRAASGGFWAREESDARRCRICAHAEMRAETQLYLRRTPPPS